jgi:hypothetical protein
MLSVFRRITIDFHNFAISILSILVIINIIPVISFTADKARALCLRGTTQKDAAFKCILITL